MRVFLLFVVACAGPAPTSGPAGAPGTSGAGADTGGDPARPCASADPSEPMLALDTATVDCGAFGLYEGARDVQVWPDLVVFVEHVEGVADLEVAVTGPCLVVPPFPS